MDGLLTDRNLKRSALIGLGITAVLTVATFSIGGLRIFDRTYTVTAVFPHAAGLSPGDRVRVAGIDVGSVSSIERDQAANAVVAKLEMKESVEVSADARASIRLRSLLGAKFVDLADDGRGPRLEPGGTIPLEHTSVPADLDQLLNAVGGFIEPLDVDAVNAVLGSFSEAIDGKGPELGKLIDQLGTLAGELAVRDDELDRLIVAGDRLSGAVASRDAELATGTEQLAVVLDTLARRREALTQVVEGVELVSARLTPLLAENREELEGIITGLHSTVSVLDEQRDRLDLALEQLPLLAERFTRITGQGSWINVYFVGMIPGPFVANPIDFGSNEGLEPGEDGGIPRIWYEPPVTVPESEVAGTRIETQDDRPPPPEGYPGR